jgi:hypothetical protein
MATISIGELKLIKQILNDLNEAFPPQPIPIQIWKDNKLIKTTSTQDQHFNAYKTYETSIWWLTCNDYSRWTDAQDFLKSYCKLFKKETKMICHPAHTHPVYDAAKKRQFKEKKCFWIGNITWTN